MNPELEKAFHTVRNRVHDCEEYRRVWHLNLANAFYDSIEHLDMTVMERKEISEKGADNFMQIAFGTCKEGNDE